MNTRGVAPPSPDVYRFWSLFSPNWLRSKGVLFGRSSPGILYAASAICARNTPAAAAINIIETIFMIFFSFIMMRLVNQIGLSR